MDSLHVILRGMQAILGPWYKRRQRGKKCLPVNVENVLSLLELDASGLGQINKTIKRKTYIHFEEYLNSPQGLLGKYIQE